MEDSQVSVWTWPVSLIGDPDEVVGQQSSSPILAPCAAPEARG